MQVSGHMVEFVTLNMYYSDEVLVSVADKTKTLVVCSELETCSQDSYIPTHMLTQYSTYLCTDKIFYTNDLRLYFFKFTNKSIQDSSLSRTYPFSVSFLAYFA